MRRMGREEHGKKKKTRRALRSRGGPTLTEAGLPAPRRAWEGITLAAFASATFVSAATFISRAAFASTSFSFASAACSVWVGD